MAENFRRAGALRERLHFQRRADGDDGMGGTIPGAGELATEFTVSAALRPLRGSEAVMADRLGGKQPYVVTVRYSQQMLEVTPAWRLKDARNALMNSWVLGQGAWHDDGKFWLDGIPWDSPEDVGARYF